MPSNDPGQRSRIADLTLDPGRRALMRGRKSIGLTSRLFRLFEVLAEDAPNVVSHDALAERVWGSRRIVTPENLTQHIALLRRALGDDAAAPRYIEAIRGEGYRLIPPVEPERPAGGLPRWLPAAAALVAIVVVAFLAGRFFGTPVLDPAPLGVAPLQALAEPDSQARVPEVLLVLPFASLSDDPDHGYFVAGLTDELINRLAQLQNPVVMGRTTSFALADFQGDVRDLGTAYDVAYVLEGSVRMDGEQVRIGAQLISTADGAPIWSQSFDRGLGDTLAIQREIGSAVARALRVRLSEGSLDDVFYGFPGTQDAQAYDLYLRAQGLIRSGALDELHRAEELLRAALVLDPDFVAARGVLARALGRLRYLEPERADELYREWDQLMQSVENSVAGHPGARFIHSLRAIERDDWVAAEESLLAGLPSIPQGPLRREAEAILAWIHRSTGRYRLALEHLERARNVDPLSLDVSFDLQRALYALGRPEESEAEYLRSLDLAGDRFSVELLALMQSIVANAADGEIERRRGRLAEVLPERFSLLLEVVDTRHDPAAALSMLREAASSGQTPVPPLAAAFWADYFGDTALAARFISEYFEQLGWVLSDLWSPFLKQTRQTAAFRSIVRDFGLLDYWRATGNWGDFCRPIGDTDFECA